MSEWEAATPLEVGQFYTIDGERRQCISGGMNMNKAWMRDKETRDKVASDILVYGGGYVVENKDGSCPIRIHPERMVAILDKKTHKPIAYRTVIMGHEVTYELENVWHGRLTVEGDES